MKALILLACFACSNAFAQDADTLRQQIEARPRSSRLRYDLGVILLDQKIYQAAANEFRAALAGDLDPPEIEGLCHLKLFRIFEATNQPGRAAAEAELALKFYPPEPKAPTLTTNPPQILDHPDPEYTPQAKLAGLEGFVRVHCDIAEDGTLTFAEVSESLGFGLDEKALEAVKQWRFAPATREGHAIAQPLDADVEFHLPNKQSRWHLVGAKFYPGPGVTSPQFADAKYPLGTGITMDALDEGKILGAVGRLGSAAISFDIDEHGEPAHFSVDSSSDALWGQQAINLIRQWRFQPGVKEGVPVKVPCVLELVWGPRELPAESLHQSRRFIYSSKR
jgi:TonB family protein